MSARRYRLFLEFEGSGFCGWQSQDADQERDQKPSIQSVVLESLRMVTRLPIEKLVGCGRTDAGVHAEIYCAHFDAPEALQEPLRVRLGLDATLPPSISVHQIEEVPATFHALESLAEKTYEYRILLRRSKDTMVPARRWWIPVESEPMPERFDLEALIKGLREFEGEHDFLSFAASGMNAKTSVRTIYETQLKLLPVGQFPHQGRELRLSFRGSGFLRHQVRNMVGTLVRVAEGRLPGSFIQELLESPSDPSLRKHGVHCAPAQGLFLKELRYEQ